MQRLFLATFMGMVLALVGVLALAAWTIDPFGQFREPQRAAMEDDPAFTLNRSLYKLLAFKRFARARQAEDRAISVIVGDSMSDQIRIEAHADEAAQDWFNLAYGGATLAENLVLVDWLLGHGAVERIVWGLPFSRFEGGRKNEMSRSIKMAANPLGHIFTFETIRGIFFVLRYRLFGLELKDPVRKLDPAERISWYIHRATVEMEDNLWPEAQIEAIRGLVARARRQGIEIVFTGPPEHPDLRALYETEFAERLARYKAFMSDFCKLDFNLASSVPWSDGMFRDPYHLAPDFKAIFTTEFFTRIDDPC